MRNIKNELEENGITIVRNFATDSECDELRSAIVDVVENADMGWVKNFVRYIVGRLYTNPQYNHRIILPSPVQGTNDIIWFILDLKIIRRTLKSISKYQ